jgi:hypothetical protein
MAFAEPPMFPWVVEKHMVEEDQEVHQWLTQEAWRYFSSQIEGAELQQHIGTWGVDGLFNDLGQNTVIDGARDEDKGYKPPLYQGPEDNSFSADSPSMRHFCASAQDIRVGFSKGAYDSGLTQAENIWSLNDSDNILAAYASGNKKAAYYYLGHVSHLLEDFTVPAHTHNDPHGTSLAMLHESYEQDYAATKFKNFHYDDSVSGTPVLTGLTILLPESIYDIFYTTANYTDDYDSNHEDGDFATGGASACYFPTFFPSTTLHKPGQALRTGGGSNSTITDASCDVMAHDLMYWTMSRVASLFRLFYHDIDTASFRARVAGANGDELSSNADSPSPCAKLQTAKFRFLYDHGQSTTIGYPVSGIRKASRILHYMQKPEGGDWSAEQTVAIASDSDSVSLNITDGSYKLWLSAENGGGYAAQTDYRYIQASALHVTTSPRGGNFEEGNPLSLSVSLNDKIGAFTYQWRKNGEVIPDADTDIFEIPSMTIADSGSYDCVITAQSGEQVISGSANVQVYPQGSMPAMNLFGAIFCGLGVIAAAMATLRKAVVR